MGSIAQRTSGRTPTSPADEHYPRLCAAVVLAAMRVTLDSWLEAAEGGGIPSRTRLRAELDRVVGELARGLDR